MNIAVAILIVVITTALAIAAMLRVRRHAPDGSYFVDGDRAAGVFGVLSTGFAVLLGFVVFLAFTSYDSARAGAEAEARIVAQQVETAQLLPPAVSGELTVELVCYARSVAGVQWDRMEAGTLGQDLNPWSVKLFHTLQRADPQTPAEQFRVQQVARRTIRAQAVRDDRVHGATGVIPTVLWIVLFFTSVLIFLFMLFFADSGDAALSQAMLMGSAVAVVVSTLLLLQFLDDPFHKGIGGLRPVAMEQTLQVINQELAASPCDWRSPATPAGTRSSDGACPHARKAKGEEA